MEIFLYLLIICAIQGGPLMILLEGICANFTLRLAKILADNIRKSGNNMRVVQ